MSDPVAVAYEFLIKDEIRRQNGGALAVTLGEQPERVIVHERGLDVVALARALASPPHAQMMKDLEPAAMIWGRDAPDVSAAISLKRIADVLAGDPERGTIVDQLRNTFDDLSHNHAQRMSR